MANFIFDTDEFMKKLNELENNDKVAKKMLDESAIILKNEIKKGINAQGNILTSSMINSIKETVAEKNQYGWYVCVRPTGKDKKGVRNMEKAVWLEYGTSKMQAKPFLTKAINNCENKILRKMQEIFEKEVEK